MSFLPIKIPQGFRKNGTDLDNAGRWTDGSLVRWQNNSARPVNGWRINEEIQRLVNSPIRGMHSWKSTSGSARYLAGGSYKALAAVLPSGLKYELTPFNYTEGIKDAGVNTGYGYAVYGDSTYGTPRPDTGNLQDCTTWSLDNWGENLVACASHEGIIYEWDIDALGTSENILLNPEFSDGTTNYLASSVPNWTTSGSGSVTYEFAGNLGGYPDWHTPLSRNAFTLDDQFILEQSFNVEVGQIYKATVWVQEFDGPDTIMRVICGGQTHTAILYRRSTPDKEEIPLIFEATATTATIQFEYVGPAGIFGWSILNPSVVKLNTVIKVPNAPNYVKSILVTEERFLFALGADANPRKIAWCDRENNTVWTPAATNEAGDIELSDNGEIMLGIRTRGQTLILTDTAAHIARYIGPPYVYGFERVGTSCGAISAKCAADVDSGVYWMGEGGFFRFDGNIVQQVPCEVYDYVYSDINSDQKSKIWAYSNAEFNEVWWYYPSEGSSEIDRYVAYNYADNHWLVGEVSRTSGVSKGVWPYAMLSNDRGQIYEHEVGLTYGDGQSYDVVYGINTADLTWVSDGANGYLATNDILGAAVANTYPVERWMGNNINERFLGDTLDHQQVIAADSFNLLQYILWKQEGNPRSPYLTDEIVAYIEGTIIPFLVKNTTKTYGDGVSFGDFITGTEGFWVDDDFMPNLAFERGVKYIFNHGNEENLGHDLKIYDGNTMLGEADNVFIQGENNSSTSTYNYKLIYSVPYDASDTLTIGCSTHSAERMTVSVSNPSLPFLETGAISLGVGDNVMQVTDLVSDEAPAAAVDVSFKTRFYPNGEEREYGPYDITKPTSVRFTGRQIRMKVDSVLPPTKWNLGTMRLETKQGGKR